MFERRDTVSKCMELRDVMQTHRGVLLIGPPGVGKTTCCTILAATLQSMAARMRSSGSGDSANAALQCLVRGGAGTVHTAVLNPRAVSRSHLFGENTSGQWSDGILASVMRRTAQDASQHPTWVVMDGEMTSSWVEGLYSVLDSTSQVNGDPWRLNTLPARAC
jgi:dynein heavy chain